MVPLRLMPHLSIVIPTYRRSEILAECLKRIAEQSVVSEIEVSVVSDGPDDKVTALGDNNTWPMEVRFLTVPKSHQGIARNAGVASAKGETVLFIGDDIFLERDACAKHLLAHTKGETAVLGYTTWDPAVGITPVMRWLETSGWQFGYPMLSAYAHTFVPKEIQHKFTYTSHISLPLKIAKKHAFCTDVHLYGWEDIEWGTRLKNDGVRLVYEPDAKALHHHRITLEDSLRRMRVLGESAVIMQRLSPEFDRVPTGLKRMAYRLLGMLPTMAGKHRSAFIKGIDGALKA